MRGGGRNATYAGSPASVAFRIRSMFSYLTNFNLMFGSILLVVIQAVFALPWLYALSPKSFIATVTSPKGLAQAIAFVLGLGIALALLLGYNSQSSRLEWGGRAYGIILHYSMLAGLYFWAIPTFLHLFFPKMGAVALAAYREAWRQPLFWLIIVGATAVTWLAVVLPYFTFGDDYKMMKQIGFDIILLATLIFGTLAASIGVSEEIEGRTAITVMSKPISRRSFLLGKFFGVLMACAAMALILAVNMNGALLANREFDQINMDRALAAEAMSDQVKDEIVPKVQSVFPSGPTAVIAKGAAMWLGESLPLAIGVLLIFGKVMILVAIATALATRLHFIVSLVSVLFVYLAGHLSSVVVGATSKSDVGAGGKLVGFLAKIFDVIMPALEFFNMGPAIIRETPISFWPFAIYSSTVFGYSIIFTAIALVIGLLLFEDRDLA